MNDRQFNFSLTNIIGIAIIGILTYLSYVPSLENGFVHWDDPVYLLENQSIRQLSPANIQQIFTSFVNGNYQPLTILTFAFEYHFFQLKPLIYHFNNLFLHIFNAILVFYLVSLLSKNKFSPFVVSLLFAIHPMHVESVAWVTERKDVLFGFFYLIALIFYANYISQKNYRLLLGTFFFFIFSLLSKPSAVSLPLILFIFDYYKGRKVDRAAVLEKVPFFFFSLVFGIIAIYAAQIPWEDPYPLLHKFTFFERVFLSTFALMTYGLKLIFPLKLSCYYPYPDIHSGLLPYSYYFSALGIGIVLWILFSFHKRVKILVFGIMFFLLTIIFNLHLYSVGRVLLADRFTYLPYIGLFFIVSELLYFFYKRKMSSSLIRRRIFLIFSFLTIAALCALTWQRCKVWKNTICLWSDVIEKYPNEPMGYYNRVNNFIEWGAIDLAINDYIKGISLVPYPEAYCGLGNMYFLKGLDTLALENYSKAIMMDPEYINAYLNRAEYYRIKGKYQEALNDYSFALTLDPNLMSARERRDKILKDIKNQEGLK